MKVEEIAEAVANRLPDQLARFRRHVVGLDRRGAIVLRRSGDAAGSKPGSRACLSRPVNSTQ